MLDTVLAAMKLAGSHLPAFKALFDAVVDTLNSDDQAALKAAYAEHIAKSDDLHRRVQEM